MVICLKCKKDVPEEEANEADAGWVCDRCAAKYFVQCDGCGIIITKGKPIEIDGYELCATCAENWESEEEEEEDEDYDDEDEYEDDEDEYDDEDEE